MAPPARAATVSVAINYYGYEPDEISVPPGTTVSWLNNDTVVHTVTSDLPGWDSGGLAPGQSFSFTFSRVGVYGYHSEADVVYNSPDTSAVSPKSFPLRGVVTVGSPAPGPPASSPPAPANAVQERAVALVAGSPQQAILAGGQSAGSFAFFTLAYAAGTTRLISLRLQPADTLATRAAGFNVYGPGGTLVAVGNPARLNGSPDVAGLADVAGIKNNYLRAEQAGTFLILVYNYGDRDVSFTLRVL